MKILLVNYEYPPLGGGGGVGTHEVALELSKRHCVHVLTSGAKELPRKEEFPDRDLTVYRAPVLLRTKKAVASMSSMLSFYPRGIRLGKQLISACRYDVINTWFAIPSGPTGVGLARKFDIPHVLTIIGGDI
ncbi:MAG: glycosyltransferase, partial [Planctomycetota bacterium]|nr:glycosyltransferase [Planctomycetota bacterium]